MSSDTVRAFVEAGVDFQLLSEIGAGETPLFLARKAKNEHTIALLTWLDDLEHVGQLYNDTYSSEHANYPIKQEPSGKHTADL